MNTDQMKPTPTPRTDALEQTYRDTGSVLPWNALNLARDLERQLAECKDNLDGSEITNAATLADLRDCKGGLAAAKELNYEKSCILDHLASVLGLQNEATDEDIEFAAIEAFHQLAADRALADRLAGELQSWGDYCGDSAPASIDLVLAAWKEARSGTV